MYAKYVYPAGATQASILDDLVKILTGTTDKALLSTGVGGAMDNATANTQTFIDVSSRPAGWTKHSTTFSGTNAVVLRAPWHSSNIATPNPATIDALQYKFAEVSVPTTTTVNVTCMEFATDVNPTVKTNAVAGQVTTNHQRIILTASGYILISASERHIALYSFNAAAYGGSSNFGMQGVFERTRLSSWDTPAAGYPPIFQAPNGSQYATSGFISSHGSPRLKNPSNADITGTSCNSNYSGSGGYGTYQMLSILGGQDFPSIGTDITTGGSTVSPLIPFGIAKGFSSAAMFGGWISDFADIWLTTNSLGRAEDEIVVSGNTYVVWGTGGAEGTSGASRYAVRKG